MYRYLYLLPAFCALLGAVAQSAAQESTEETTEVSFPVGAATSLSAEEIQQQIDLMGGAATDGDTSEPIEAATSQSTESFGDGTRYLVRLGFDEFYTQEHVHVTDQFSAQGIHFQPFGTGNGSRSFESISIAPFGNRFWMNAAASSGTTGVFNFFSNGNEINFRYITFDQPASYVSFEFTMTQQFPVFARTIVTVWDGPNGTGNVLNDDPTQFKFFPGFQLPYNLGQKDFWEFAPGVPVVKSISIITTPNRFSFDNLIIDSATAPLGGYLDITSTLDGFAVPPSVYLDGTPTLLGTGSPPFVFPPRGISPEFKISVPEGGHLVTLYSPGYEWYQEYVEVQTGVVTTVIGDLGPVSPPTVAFQVNLQAGGTDIDVGNAATPSLTDWNDDGSTDLLVGNAAGEVLVYLNLGTNDEPLYDTGFTVLPSNGTNAAPLALEFYHVGRKQLVVGYQDGTVREFFNTGTDASPAFAGSPFDTLLVTAPSADANPCMADFDGDGNKDLLVGCADGNVYFYPNQRLDQSPTFNDAAPITLCTVGSNASPAAVLDWDGDGLIDLVVGDGDGHLNLFLNEGTAEVTQYSTSTRIQDETGADIDVGTNAHPLVGYYDGDSVKDLLVGNAAGNVRAFLSSSLNAPPVASAGGPYEAECAGATKTLMLDGTGSSDPDGDALTYSWSTDCPGASFDDPTSATPTLTIDTSSGPLTCQATLSVSDGVESDADSASVTVIDTTPPELSLSVSPHIISPPNHKMVSVIVTYTLTDICDPEPTVVLTGVTNSEADDSTGAGDGNTQQDIQEADLWTADTEVLLRAERAGAGDGRVYTLTYLATDASGNETEATITVEVPHDSSSHSCDDPDCDLNGT